MGKPVRQDMRRRIQGRTGPVNLSEYARINGGGVEDEVGFIGTSD
jgi:hypothetical protein